ncbi:MAG: LuxR C-terminal-related transcriptional regulator [Nannocystaceae bacterium]
MNTAVNEVTTTSWGESVPESTPPIRSALADLVSNYRRPALLADQRGTIVAMSSNAEVSLDPSGDGPSDRALASWPHYRLEVRTEAGTYFLLVPEGPEAEVAPSRPRKIQLPPRLAKIARLVISGCTDKQIATRTGLSFSTVRTYVRQIYRRLGVHSRVELVHATSMGLTIE